MALGITPSSVAVQVNLGLSLALSGDAPGAVRLLQPLATVPSATPRVRHDLALALAPSRERRLETGGTGRAFADAIRAAWPDGHCPALPRDGDVAYPVAFGAAAGAGAILLVRH